MTTNQLTVRERLMQKAAHARLPIMSAFELTPACTLNCKMCYVHKSYADVRQEGGLMDAGQWLALAAEARDLGLLFPLLTGGEPLLHPQFREIMAGMQQMGLQVSINSNATLIDEPMARWLGHHCPVRINITLYGASAETYQNLCGDGSAFEKVHRAVELLQQNHVPVKFNASITPENVNDLDEIIAYAHRVGSPIQVATYMFPPLRRDASLVGQNDRLTPEQAGLARVRADFLQNNPAWFLGQARRFQHFVPLDQIGAGEDRGPMRISCRAGLCSFWLDWHGNMSNCGMYGSVTVERQGRPLRDAWQELVEKTAAVRYRPACAGCPNQPLCHACIAMVHNECGDLNGRPEYLCRMNEAAARYYAEYAARLPDTAEAGEHTDPPADPCEL
ncbi:MAG: radical SAM protein [Gemmiger sp.]|uniref:radical SAM protein n=1 Tax=Gemmiger sp. TaxID=2049027 RepID=UPI002E799D5B|nr:radical SAM protein [Gemmiger sp.]MEE0801586.1 radical SAM protein [Gemmiger sp.]